MENTQDSEPLSKSDLLGLYEKIKSNYAINYEISEKPEVKLIKRLIDAGVSKKYLFADMSNIPQTLKKQVEGFDIGKGYYIWGGIGTGKTYLICALVRAYLLRLQELGKLDSWYTPKIASVPDILLDIKHSFKEHSTKSEQDIIYKYSKTKCLLLDDLGTEKLSDWVIQTLYSIVDNRYNEELQTIFTSNLSLDSIQERIGDRIPSRIAEMCEVVHIKGADRRLKK